MGRWEVVAAATPAATPAARAAATLTARAASVCSETGRARRCGGAAGAKERGARAGPHEGARARVGWMRTSDF